MVKLTESTAGGPMKVLVRLRASSMEGRHREGVAGSRDGELGGDPKRSRFLCCTNNMRVLIDAEADPPGLPGRALNLAQEWELIHREELLEAWRFCRENRSPAQIEPLT